MNNFKYLLNGIWKENPLLVLVLGTCPALAVTTEAFNGLGMGLASMFVLFFSNTLIALLKNLIPDKIRIVGYIIIIATFVTIVDLVIKAFIPALYETLGIFIPLIVVNCIILGRAEAFAQRNSVIPAMLDGLGMGIGFTLALTIMGSFRELLGNGSLFGYKFLNENANTILLFIMPPGAFITFGYLIALTNKIKKI